MHAMQAAADILCAKQLSVDLGQMSARGTTLQNGIPALETGLPPVDITQLRVLGPGLPSIFGLSKDD